jgi:hypothetical protein
MDFFSWRRRDRRSEVAKFSMIGSPEMALMPPR